MVPHKNDIQTRSKVVLWNAYMNGGRLEDQYEFPSKTWERGKAVFRLRIS